MTEAIEGLWWLDFTRQPPRDPSGNEFILSGGVVSTGQTGRPAGTYHFEPGALTIVLPMPTIPDEGPWRMVAQFPLSDPSNPPDRLAGTLRAIDSDEELIANDICTLVRRTANA